MAIRQIEITNFRGIECLVAELPPGGVVATGRNGAGKTSFVRALQAALTGAGFGSEAITTGKDVSKLLVRLDDGTEVARSVSRDGSPRLAVTMQTDAGRVKPEKPAAWLARAVGSTLDPLEFYLSKPAERRALVMRAMPITVTREQVLQWVPEIPAGIGLDRHGLEVVGALYDHFYAARTRANASAAEAQRAAQAAQAAADAAPGGEDVDVARMEAEARSAADAVTQARAEYAAAERAHAEWERRSGGLDGARAKVETARAARVRAVDAGNVALAVAVSACTVFADGGPDASAARVIEAMQALLRAEAAAEAAAESLRAAMAAHDSLAAAVGAEPERVSESAIVEAEQAAQRAQESLRDARAHDAALRERARLQDAASGARERAEAASVEAARLDEIVKRLQRDVPAALIAASGGIRGLTVNGDTIALDGTPIDTLCGAEQLQLAVEIAKRAHGGGAHKIMVVDGLERLDDEQLALFANLTDGWDVIASRVGAGDLSLRPLHGGEAKLERAEVVV